jgi:hypothetical protein
VTSLEIDERSEELESSLKPVEGAYDLKDDVRAQVIAEAFVIPVESNASFRAAFQALEKGCLVERLDEDMGLAGTSYSKGSFVVHQNKDKDAWNAVLNNLPFEAGWITEKGDLPASPVTMPRIALVETYFHDMDAGWTRFIFDTYHIPYTVLHPDQFPETDLAI